MSEFERRFDQRMIASIASDFPVVVYVPSEDCACTWVQERFGDRADWVIGLSSDPPPVERYSNPNAVWDIYSAERSFVFFFKECTNAVVEFKLKFG